ESSLPQSPIDRELRLSVFRNRLGYQIHARQFFQFNHGNETIANTLNFTIGNPVAPLESFDGLVGAPGQKVHSRLRGIVDECLTASHCVQEGNIEPHDAESDHTDFVYFLNHKKDSVGRIRLHRRYHSNLPNSMSFRSPNQGGWCCMMYIDLVEVLF